MASYSRVTFRQIAREAGVSVMTVSYAMRNQRGVSPEMRARIIAIAKELGYRPDAELAALQTQRRRGQSQQKGNVIAFITSARTSEGWRVHQAYYDGALQRATQMGYRLETIWAKQPGMTGERLSKILYYRGIRGLLLAPLHASRGHLTLDWSRFAVATLGQSLWRPKIHRAMTDLTQTLVNLLHELRKMGRRRVGMVTQRVTNERTNYAYSMPFWGFYDGKYSKDLVPPLLTVEGTGEPFLKHFKSWIETHHPDTIICNLPAALCYWRSLPPHAKSKIDYIYLTGTNTPEDVSNLFLGGYQVGAQAIDLLIEQIMRNETGIPEHPKTILVDGCWFPPGVEAAPVESYLPTSDSAAFSMEAVASQLGVSRITVSRALANSPLVAEPTKKRICTLADALGYQANPMVASFMRRVASKKASTSVPIIGMVVPSDFSEFEELQGDCLGGAKARAEELGYRLQPFEITEGKSFKDVAVNLHRRKIRGVVIGPWLRPLMLDKNDWAQFVGVAMGHSILSPAFHRIAFNIVQAVFDSTRKLKRLGYKRIALYLDSLHHKRTNHLYLMAFVEFQQTLPEGERIKPTFYDSWDQSALRRFIRREKPDVILCDSVQILRGLECEGLAVPEDIGFVHVTRVGAVDAMAGIKYNSRLAGCSAIDLVVEQLQRNERGSPAVPKTVLIDGEWHEGQTVRQGAGNG